MSAKRLNIQQQLFARWFGANPFVGIPVAEQISTRRIDDPVFAELVKYRRPRTILEVGTWLGASAIHMARCLKASGLRSSVVVCVDTWLGSPENWHRVGPSHPEWGYERLGLKNGYPRLYFEFMSNVVTAGQHDLIVPLPQTSDNALVMLQRTGLKFDMIFVDGAHEEEPAYKDLNNYTALLSENGILFGDDYPNWDGVRCAVHRYADEQGLDFVAKAGRYVFYRDDELRERLLATGMSAERCESFATYGEHYRQAQAAGDDEQMASLRRQMEYWHPLPAAQFDFQSIPLEAEGSVTQTGS